MSARFLVQDDLPLPKIDRSSGHDRRKWPVVGMTPGQAFFVPGKAGKSVTSYISRITKDLPGTYSSRRAWCREDGVVDEKVKWAACEETDEGAVKGITVTRTA